MCASMSLTKQLLINLCFSPLCTKAPSEEIAELIAWECGSCTFTNKDCTHRSCMMCMTDRPARYLIVAGATKSTTANTTTVNCCGQARLAAVLCKQEHLVALHDGPMAKDEHIAKGVALAPALGGGGGAASFCKVPRCVMVERLVDTLVDIVRIVANNRGHTCPHHSCCGMHIVEKSKVACQWEQMVFHN